MPTPSTHKIPNTNIQTIPNEGTSAQVKSSLATKFLNWVATHLVVTIIFIVGLELLSILTSAGTNSISSVWELWLLVASSLCRGASTLFIAFLGSVLPR